MNPGLGDFAMFACNPPLGEEFMSPIAPRLPIAIGHCSTDNNAGALLDQQT